MRFVLVMVVLTLSLLFGCTMGPEYGVPETNGQNGARIIAPKNITNTAPGGMVNMESCIKQIHETLYPAIHTDDPYRYCSGDSDMWVLSDRLEGMCSEGTAIGQKTDIYYCTIDVKTCKPIVETENNTIVKKYKVRYQATYTIPKSLGKRDAYMNQRNYSSCNIMIIDER